jgi:hypothetical protein
MSREERKMAQIIASIERMEQESRASGDDAGRPLEVHEVNGRNGRGKKSKKGKFPGARGRPGGRKLKVTAVGSKAPFERKLTPKKRWIQLWSSQLDTSKDKDASSSSEGPEGIGKDAKDFVQANKPSTLPEAAVVAMVAMSPVSEIKVTPVTPPAPVTVVAKETPKITEKPVALPSATASVTPLATVKAEKPACVPASISVRERRPQEQATETQAPKKQVTEKQSAETPMATSAATTPKATTTPKAANAGAAATSSSSELRVKTPLNNESSHLSPPLERNSPTTTASISPSAKVKDSDTPNSNTAAAAVTAAKFSPAATEQERPVVGEKKEPPRSESAPKLERKNSSSSSVGKAEDSYRREPLEHHHERGRKRSLERTEAPMSEEARRRAERRRKRKSNWDVGDPRKGGSPIPDPPISAAAAAANQQSFAKYPPNRPGWRHSQSMMDVKPPCFQSGHRSSSFYSSGPSSGGRRDFYHSTSLPQDRSRSAGRSSTRYSYGTNGTSSSTSNYR